MDATLFLAASAAVNRFVEFIKPRIRALSWSVEAQDSALVFIAVLAGVMLAFLSNLNLFTIVPRLPDFAAVALTGVLVGLGSDVLNAVLDLLYNWKDNSRKV